MLSESKELYISSLPPGLPIYYQPAFLDAIADNWSAIISSVNSEVEWMFPCVIRRKYGITFYGPAELAHDNAIITLKKDGNYSDSPREIGFLNNIIINDRRSTIPHNFLPGFTKSMRNKQFIDLKSYPTEISQVKKSRQRNLLRKCSDCKLVETDNIKRFYDLYSSSFGRRGLKVRNLEDYQQIFDSLSENYETRLLILEDTEGRDLAANWIVGFQESIYATFLAKNYAIDRPGAQEHIFWNVIQDMRNRYDTWDLCGSDIPGVKRFNMKMGAENVTYPVYELFKPRVLKKLFHLFNPHHS